MSETPERYSETPHVTMSALDLAAFKALASIQPWIELRCPDCDRLLGRAKLVSAIELRCRHCKAMKVFGEIQLRTMPRFVFSEMFYLQGVKDRSAVSRAETYAYYELLKRGDGGRNFLKVMRGFELTEEKQQLLWDGLAVERRPDAHESSDVGDRDEHHQHHAETAQDRVVSVRRQKITSSRFMLILCENST